MCFAAESEPEAGPALQLHARSRRAGAGSCMRLSGRRVSRVSSRFGGILRLQICVIRLMLDLGRCGPHAMVVCQGPNCWKPRHTIPLSFSSRTQGTSCQISLETFLKHHDTVVFKSVSFSEASYPVFSSIFSRQPDPGLPASRGRRSSSARNHYRLSGIAGLSDNPWSCSNGPIDKKA